MTMETLAVVLIVKNEAARIAQALASVTGIADEIVVLDDCSTDRTVAICEAFGATVHTRRLDDFASQRTAALAYATNDWVLMLDADEDIPWDLAQEIHTLLRKGTPCNGFYLRRIDYLCGQRVEHSFGMVSLLRLFRRTEAAIINRVHEKIVVPEPTAMLPTPFRHYNSRTLKEFWAKNRHYFILDAQKRVADGERSSLLRMLGAPLKVFCYRYLGLQGYRDGRPGLAIATVLALGTFQLHRQIRRAAAGGELC
jgi:glycosyltransferase involved in cell wall biosynthesis